MASPTGQVGHGKYPRQAVLMITDEMADRVEREAIEQRKSKSEVLRGYLDGGFALADEVIGPDVNGNERAICPVHHQRDCSPLLNGCARLTA